MTPPFRQPPYSYVLAAAYVVWVLPEVVDAVRDEATGPDLDGRSKHALYAAIGLGVGGAVGLGFRAPPWATFDPLAVELFWVGVGLVVVGVGLRWYSAAVLGDAFSRSVTVSDGQAVVDSGPYAVVRHPSYTGSLVTVLGFGCALGTWPGLAWAIGLVGAGYAYRIRVEEDALRRELDGYAAYCERTPYRLVPGVY